jgi:hypothetical protein
VAEGCVGIAVAAHARWRHAPHRMVVSAEGVCEARAHECVLQRHHPVQSARARAPVHVDCMTMHCMRVCGCCNALRLHNACCYIPPHSRHECPVPAPRTTTVAASHPSGVAANGRPRQRHERACVAMVRCCGSRQPCPSQHRCHMAQWLLCGNSTPTQNMTACVQTPQERVRSNFVACAHCACKLALLRRGGKSSACRWCRG